mmetsp:Transcript_50114/g.154867  ORF Transcript_50114/g.154867 Transcript_50114/m.154867 type:complete len:272 (+) Transcript_50114:588-1403(+)
MAKALQARVSILTFLFRRRTACLHWVNSVRSCRKVFARATASVRFMCAKYTQSVLTVPLHCCMCFCVRLSLARARISSFMRALILRIFFFRSLESGDSSLGAGTTSWLAAIWLGMVSSWCIAQVSRKDRRMGCSCTSSPTFSSMSSAPTTQTSCAKMLKRSSSTSDGLPRMLWSLRSILSTRVACFLACTRCQRLRNAEGSVPEGRRLNSVSTALPSQPKSAEGKLLEWVMVAAWAARRSSTRRCSNNAPTVTPGSSCLHFSLTACTSTSS